MNKKHRNFSKSVTIINELGLHARAAARIAELAVKAKETIWIIKDGEKIDAASIIDILTLGCSKGAAITFTSDNESDFEIINNIVTLTKKGFGEQ
ncbi:MAG: HPr family phosphocarrier protein [Desulfobacteraceae bacterium]|jgi:phosphocarrier protein|nr:MAG: HPr family phosphocarrier protein [Desulfobacteraceae bacterium]